MNILEEIKQYRKEKDALELELLNHVHGSEQYLAIREKLYDIDESHDALIGTLMDTLNQVNQGMVKRIG